VNERPDVNDRPRADYRPTGTDARQSLFVTLKRTALEFKEDNLADWAAALTYYGLLSLFPALIVLVSIVGIFGDPATTTRELTDIVTQIGPSSAADTFSGPIESITSNRSTAGILLVVGLATALWAASNYVGAFMRASNIAWETPEGRSFFKLRPLQILVTLAMVIVLAFVALSLVLTGPIVEAVGSSIGVGDTALTVWDIAKWPVLLLLVSFMFALLYWASPNARQGFRWVTPGGILAVVVLYWRSLLVEGAVIPEDSIRSIRVLDRFSFVELGSEEASRAVSYRDGTKLKGKQIRMEIARS